MPLVVADRVRETTTTTGTGTITLAGAVTGYQSFSAIGNGNTTYYTINAGSQWEVGIGTYLGAGPTLSRDTVLESSNSGSLVNFSAGTKDVFVTYPAEKSISDGYGLLPVANGGTGQSSYTNGQLLIGNSTGNTLTKATLTAGTNISITNGSGAITINATDQYVGTVTSVNASGGTTGLTFSGGPITTSGTLTLAGTLGVPNGGTGATSLTSGYLVKGNGTSAVSASVVYDDGTNVGIGTSSFTNTVNNFVVRQSGTGIDLGGSASTAAIRVRGTSGGAGLIDFYPVSSDPNASPYYLGRIFYDNASNYMSLSTNSAERMRIDSSGNVGIGTSSPGAKLDVQGSSSDQIRVRTASSEYYRFGRNSSTGYMDFYGSQTGYTGYTFGGVDGERFRIDSSGNLLVGTTSATGRSGVTTRFVASAPSGYDTAYLLQTTNAQFALTSHVNTTSGTRYHVGFGDGTTWTERGTISTNGSTTSYNTSSDYRLKEIDGPIANSGAYIDALKPVQGSWKSDGSRFIGLLAHEVQEVSETQIATGEKDGDRIQGMDYSAPELIANLIAELQSLRARVAQLEGK